MIRVYSGNSKFEMAGFYKHAILGSYLLAPQTAKPKMTSSFQT